MPVNILFEGTNAAAAAAAAPLGRKKSAAEALAKKNKTKKTPAPVDTLAAATVGFCLLLCTVNGLTVWEAKIQDLFGVFSSK